MSEKTFMKKYADGEAKLDDIDDYVDLWHDGADDPGDSLAKFLGLTDAEYKLWAEDPTAWESMMTVAHEKTRRGRIPAEQNPVPGEPNPGTSD